MNKKELKAVEKLFADRQKHLKELFDDMEKSRKIIDRIDKSLHKNLWFNGMWIGMLIVQLWAIFFGGGLNYLFSFCLLQLDLMLIMFIVFIKSKRGYNGLQN